MFHGNADNGIYFIKLLSESFCTIRPNKSLWAYTSIVPDQGAYLHDMYMGMKLPVQRLPMSYFFWSNLARRLEDACREWEWPEESHTSA